jgi:hypothetical protein
MPVSAVSRRPQSLPPPSPPPAAEPKAPKGLQNTGVTTGVTTGVNVNPPGLPDPKLNWGSSAQTGVDSFETEGGAGASGQVGAQVGLDGLRVGLGGRAGAGVGGVSVSGTGPGGIEGEAHINGPSISVEGHADTNLSKDGLDIDLGVDVDATLADAGASAKKTIDFEVAGEKFSAELDLSASGKIGAEGKINLNVHLGLDGKPAISASAEGFAGARAELKGEVALKHEGDTMLSGGITASATAGVGGNAHANLDFEGGTAKFDVGAEATVGVGLGLDISGEVNLGEIGEAALDLATHGAFGDIKDSISDFGHKIEDKAKDLWNSIF